MIQELGTYFAVFSTSMFKFVFGPILGTLADMSVIEVAILTVLGMMTSVVIFALVGEKVKKLLFRRFLKNKRIFSSKNRKRVRFWRNYGLKGVAFLTPILFSPIVGTMLASSFGESKRRILAYMLVSSVFWALVLSFFFHHAINISFIHNFVKA